MMPILLVLLFPEKGPPPWKLLTPPVVLPFKKIRVETKVPSSQELAKDPDPRSSPSKLSPSSAIFNQESYSPQTCVCMIVSAGCSVFIIIELLSLGVGLEDSPEVCEKPNKRLKVLFMMDISVSQHDVTEFLFVLRSTVLAGCSAFTIFRQPTLFVEDASEVFEEESSKRFKLLLMMDGNFSRPNTTEPLFALVENVLGSCGKLLAEMPVYEKVSTKVDNQQNVWKRLRHCFTMTPPLPALSAFPATAQDAEDNTDVSRLSNGRWGFLMWLKSMLKANTLSSQKMMFELVSYRYYAFRDGSDLTPLTAMLSIERQQHKRLPFTWQIHCLCKRASNFSDDEKTILGLSLCVTLAYRYIGIFLHGIFQVPTTGNARTYQCADELSDEIKVALPFDTCPFDSRESHSKENWLIGVVDIEWALGVMDSHGNTEGSTILELADALNTTTLFGHCHHHRLSNDELLNLLPSLIELLMDSDLNQDALMDLDECLALLEHSLEDYNDGYGRDGGFHDVVLGVEWTEQIAWSEALVSPVWAESLTTLQSSASINSFDGLSNRKGSGIFVPSWSYPGLIPWPQCTARVQFTLEVGLPRAECQSLPPTSILLLTLWSDFLFLLGNKVHGVLMRTYRFLVLCWQHALYYAKTPVALSKPSPCVVTMYVFSYPALSGSVWSLMMNTGLFVKGDSTEQLS